MLLLLIACQTENKDPDSTDTTSGPAYYGQIDALVADNCARCHTADGQARSFDDPADVQAMAANMLARVESGEMPPPAPDPACRDYTGSERFVMDEAETELLRAWVEAGTPLGDPADASSPPQGTTLAPFDVELIAPTAWQPSFRDGENDYRCFRLDLQNADTVYLTGMEAIVDNLSIVHHVVIYDAGSTDPSDELTGFSCSGFGENGWGYLAGWAPGSQALSLPEGMGMPLAPQTTLVLQMHYYNSFDGAENELDQSGYGLKLADSVEREVGVLSLGAYSFSIPAGETMEVSETELWSERRGEGQILGVWPHMHLFGQSFDMSVTDPDGGETCLLSMDGWDFHNQVSSLYLEPFALSGGESIQTTCRYDNTAENPRQPNDPPQTIQWGEGTGDEMCFGFTYVAL